MPRSACGNSVRSARSNATSSGSFSVLLAADAGVFLLDAAPSTATRCAALVFGATFTVFAVEACTRLIASSVEEADVTRSDCESFAATGSSFDVACPCSPEARLEAEADPPAAARAECALESSVNPPTDAPPEPALDDGSAEAPGLRDESFGLVPAVTFRVGGEAPRDDEAGALAFAATPVCAEAPLAAAAKRQPKAIGKAAARDFTPRTISRISPPSQSSHGNDCEGPTLPSWPIDHSAPASPTAMQLDADCGEPVGNLLNCH